MKLRALLFLLLASTALAEPLSTAWTVADAPYRVEVNPNTLPDLPEAGIQIILPDMGQARPDLADVVLTDGEGQPQPLAKIGYRPGGHILMLAQKLEPNTKYYVYFGANKLRICPEWIPSVSLLMETRPAPKDLAFDSLQSLKAAWAKSPEYPGAAFVSQIYHAGNPFGPNDHFLTHYTGYLRIPKAREITFYTLSSDCSFVVVNNQVQFGWPGRHTPDAVPKSLPKKAVACPEGLVKIDYYAAKGDNPFDGRQGAASVFGWQIPGGFEAIPPESWLHPGSANVGPIQSVDGQPVPVVKARVATFINHADQGLYEIEYELRVPRNTEGWSVTWEFEDGAITTGLTGHRVLTGKDSQTVKCQIVRNGVMLNELYRLDIPTRPQRASVNDPTDVRRYLSLILAEANNKFRPETTQVRLSFLQEFGTDQDVAKFAADCPQQDQSDGVWLLTRLASIRAHAQTDVEKAKQEFYSLQQSLPPAMQKTYAVEIAEVEMNIIVFCMRDPQGVGRLTQIAFQNSGTEANRTAKIRIGDLYRILGNYKEAAAQYQTLGSKEKEQALAAKDSASSIAVRDLLEKGFNREAQAKLFEWERRRPMVKFDSDYLLLRARTLLALSRWTEALTELESFQKVQPDSAYQTDAQYYMAQILYEKGSKEEARKIWNTFASDYPKHPLTPKAREWAKKP